MKKIILSIFVISLLISCDKSFKYPDSKTWKHGVYSKNEARSFEGVFDGLEVDVVYSPEKNDIYVGRVVADTSENLPLDEWLSVLKEPAKMSYWIDFKNLSADNAEKALAAFDKLVKKYNIEDRFFVESQDIKALKFAKKKGN